MSKQADITFNNNVIFVTGELDFSNVMSVQQKCLVYLNSQAELNIDFSHLKSSDSSGLALIIEWIKFAKLQKKKISVKNIPQPLISIAKAARIEKLIEC